MRNGLVRRLKSLVIWLALSAAAALMVLGFSFAPTAASALGLPPVVGTVVWAVLLLLALAIGIVAWLVWWISCRIGEIRATQARIADLDSTISGLRDHPGEDAAIAAALEEKVWGLVLIDSVPEAKEVQAELVRIAAASSDATLWDRVEEFRHMLDVDEEPDEV